MSRETYQPAEILITHHPEMNPQIDVSPKTFQIHKLNIHIYESPQQTIAGAAGAVADQIRRLIADRGRAIGLFESAPSQNEFLDLMAAADGIEWTRVIGFHLEEYLELGEDAPQSFRRRLIDRLVGKVPMAEFHGIRGEAANASRMCANYAAILRSRPPDFAVLEIGENGRLAFNYPTVCDFNDPAFVRIVELDEVYRQAEVRSGAFAKLDDVPRHVATLTIPAIISCPRLFVSVSGEQRAEAMRAALKGEIEPSCPASILQAHNDVHLFLDRDAARLT